MRVEAPKRLLMLAATLTGATVLAFEPGKERVCVASADGARFECHDKQAVETDVRDATALPVQTPSEPRTPMPADVPEPEPTRTATAVPAPAAPNTSAGALPNYLLQDPSSARPAAISTAAPEPEPARPASTAAATTPAATPAHAPVAAPRDEPAEPVAAPAPAPAPATPAAAPASAPTIEPTPAATVTPSREASAPVVQPARRAVGHAEFRRLTGTRYTLELARADRAGAFDALLAALADVGGRFYVVALRSPAGPSYSLLWNDYASIEDARAARARLPADVAITSGWPRRIGPLQAELGP